MAVVVRLVLGLATDTDENEHNQVGHKVAKGVDSVGHHRSTMPHDASHKLKEEKDDVHRPSYQGDFIDFLVSFHFSARPQQTAKG